MSRKFTRLACAALSFALISSLLTGCGSDKQSTAKETASPSAQVNTATPMPTVNTDSALSRSAEPSPTQSPAPTPEFYSGLSQSQLNSINMLNYLVVLTRQINTSKGSRLYLESAYSQLLNNTNPEVVDFRTEREYANILDTLNDCRMIAEKREHIQFIYEREQAQAISAVLPDPFELLKNAGSISTQAELGSLLPWVVYNVVYSYSNYTSALSEAKIDYLHSGWELNEEEATALHNSRKQTFSYMTQIVRNNQLPGRLTLTEEAVDNFVKWQSLPTVRRIQMLKDNEETYVAYGGYWLELAKSYYENGNYAECISALGRYEALQIGIYRHDIGYANVLPLAIVSAEHVCSDDEYVQLVSEYADKLVANIGINDWALRYFAAQTYIKLFGMTGNIGYLETAYSLTLSNVNYLIDTQEKLNKTYLEPVKKPEYPAGATKAKKAEIDEYSSGLTEARKTELPPVCEPLLLNAELLFALAEKLEVSESEYATLYGILHNGGGSLFITSPLDELFKPASSRARITSDTINITYSGAEIIIPARFLSESFSVEVTAVNSDMSTTFTDWTVSKVERKSEGDADTFTATLTSKSADQYSFENDGTAITITINPCTASGGIEPLRFNYNVHYEDRSWIYGDILEFNRDNP